MRSTHLYVTVLIFLIFTNLLFSQAESTLAGGPWTSPSTWKDGVVPNASDFIVIKGPVTLDVITNAGDLRIEAGGSLKPEVITSATTYHLYVTKDVTNYGTLDGYNLDLHVGGNLYNNGTWTTGYIMLEDTSSHYITAYPGSKFSPSEIKADSATLRSSGNVYLDSVKVWVKNFYLGNNDPVFPSDTLYLTHHSVLRVDNFYGNGNTIYLQNVSYLYSAVTGGTTPLFKDVRLKGDVEIGANLNFSGDIFNDGIMFPRFYNFNPTLKINGNFTNNGEIKANEWGDKPYFEISGNLTNNGTWDSHQIKLTGHLQHLLITDGSKTFSPEYFISDSSAVISGSDIRFDDSRVQVRKFTLQSGNNLYLNTGSYLKTDEFTGNGNFIQLLDNSYLHSAFSSGKSPVYNNVSLKGQVAIGANVIFTGNIFLQGSMFSRFYNSSPTVTINGNFVNNGEIKENSSADKLFFNIAGNITNNGDWSSNQLKLTGDTQYLTTDTSKTFSPYYFTTDSATVISNSDIRFDACKVQVKKFILQNKNNLYLNSGAKLQTDEFIGNGNFIRLSGNSYLFSGFSSGTTGNYQNITLKGQVGIGANVNFTGDIYLQGTMYSQFYNSSPTVTIDGNFVNNGEIKENSSADKLFFNISGNITNNGNWSSNQLKLTGDTQYLTTDTSKIFSPYYFTTDSATVISNSDIRFDACKVQVKKFILQNKNNLYLNSGAKLQTDEFSGNNNFILLSGNSYLFSAFTSGGTPNYSDVKLKGDVGIGSTMNFSGDVFLEGTMYPQFYNSSPTIVIFGTFQNSGEIKANTSGDKLSLDIKDNFENAGKCEVYQLSFSGMDDQHFSIKDSSSSVKNVRFSAMRSGNTYQWLKDGAPLVSSGNVSGVTSYTLKFKSVTPNDFGVYKCKIDSNGTILYSREITVNNVITAIDDAQAKGGNKGRGGDSQYPEKFALYQNYPNPFNPTTTLKIDLPERAHVILRIYDYSGRMVKELANGWLMPGTHLIKFDGNKLASGAYFYRIQAKPVSSEAGAVYTETKKMILLK
ncbi:MAG: hypothetical protein GXO77_11560 [Calditrichaeota bacterium]|nr:hypothetical protein [Calditrichota bacterium]